MDEAVIGLVAIICCCLPFVWGIIHTICMWCMKAYTYDKELALKHRLIDAGMSADEIVRVIESGGLPNKKPKKAVAKEAAKQPAYVS